MFDVVVVGSLNMDTVIKVQHLPKPGETIHGISMHKFPGGKGGNQAVALARLGNSVAIMGMVGDDENGRVLKGHLEEDGVETQFLCESPNQPSGTSEIIVDENGNNEIIVISGANAEVNQALIEKFASVFQDSKYVLIQYEIPIETVKILIKIAEENQIPVVINPSPYYPLSDKLLSKIYCLVLNESEASAMLGDVIVTSENAQAAALQIAQKGVSQVVITLGENGAVYCDQNKKTNLVPPVKVIPVDATGSGDAFMGGLLHSLLEGKSLEDAVNFANIVGAITVTKLGAQTSLPYLDEVVNFTKQ